MENDVNIRSYEAVSHMGKQWLAVIVRRQENLAS